MGHKLSAPAFHNSPNFRDNMMDFREAKDRIEDALAHLSYSNGVMTAAITAPEMVSPSAWLPLIADLSGTGNSIEEAQLAVNLMLFEYNKILESLNAPDKDFKPFFWKDEDQNIITQDWAQGFVDGMRLKLDAWAPVLKNAEKCPVILPMLILADPDRYQQERTTTEPPLDDLLRDLEKMIPNAVQLLYDEQQYRQKYASRKTGRNAPCPCGSGKKYKKCCLQ